MVRGSVPSVQADLDHAATTPPRPEVLEVLERWIGAGNASARHLPGQAARRAVEHAREQVAGALGCGPHDVVFTSGGTEADNMAVKGVAWAARERHGGGPAHLVTTAVEHAAVLEPARWLAARGDIELDVVAPRPDGRVAVDDVLARVRDGSDGRPPTALVSVMGANNELGSVNDVATLGAELRERGVPLHVDAVQCVATLDVSLERWAADALAVSAHKVGGPQGVGVAVMRRGLAAEPTTHGGGQDRGLRSGTFAVGLIAACGEALARAAYERDALRSRLVALSGRLADGLAGIEGVRRSGPVDPEQRLASHVHVMIDGVDGEALALGLDAAGIAASAGSACSSGASTGSHVVAACGLSGAPLRLSLGWTSTEAEVDHAVAVLGALIPRLRDGGDVFGLGPVGRATVVR
jgi:cysteine desulfurase